MSEPECKECPNQSKCMLMDSLIKIAEEEEIRWEKEVVPLLKRTEEMLARTSGMIN